ncbi:hypothetical protein [Flindersiella endophytica]
MNQPEPGRERQGPQPTTCDFKVAPEIHIRVHSKYKLIDGAHGKRRHAEARRGDPVELEAFHAPCRALSRRRSRAVPMPATCLPGAARDSDASR